MTCVFARGRGDPDETRGLTPAAITRLLLRDDDDDADCGDSSASRTPEREGRTHGGHLRCSADAGEMRWSSDGGTGGVARDIFGYTGDVVWLRGEMRCAPSSGDGGAGGANGYSNGLCAVDDAKGVPRNVGCGCGAASGGIGTEDGRVAIAVGGGWDEEGEGREEI